MSLDRQKQRKSGDMSQTLPIGQDVATSSGRGSVTLLDSMVQQRLPTLSGVFKDIKSIVTAKDEEIDHLKKEISALQESLSKQKKSHASEEVVTQITLEKERALNSVRNYEELVAISNRELTSLRSQLKQQTDMHDKQLRSKDEVMDELHREIERLNSKYKSDLREKDKIIHTMKDAFDALTEKFTRSSSSEDGPRCKKIQDAQLPSNPANIPSSSEVQNVENGESARGPDSVPEKSAAATPAAKRPGATGEPAAETITSSAKGSTTTDSAHRFQCVICGIAYCEAEALGRHQARDCGDLLDAGPPRQKQVSVERDANFVEQNHRSSEQTSQVQTILGQKERGNEQRIARNGKDTTNHEESPTSNCTPEESNASDVTESISDSDDANDILEETVDHPDFSSQGTSAGKTSMGRGDPKYHCKCGRLYSTLGSLKFHESTDCGKPMLQCKKCEGWFLPRSYEKHINRNNCILKDDLKKPCIRCQYVAKNTRSYKSHQRLCKKEEKIMKKP